VEDMGRCEKKKDIFAKFLKVWKIFAFFPNNQKRKLTWNEISLNFVNIGENGKETFGLTLLGAQLQVYSNIFETL
jgi:hypothetical protein